MGNCTLYSYRNAFCIPLIQFVYICIRVHKGQQYKHGIIIITLFYNMSQNMCMYVYLKDQKLVLLLIFNWLSVFSFSLYYNFRLISFVGYCLYFTKFTKLFLYGTTLKIKYSMKYISLVSIDKNQIKKANKNTTNKK